MSSFGACSGGCRNASSSVCRGVDQTVICASRTASSTGFGGHGSPILDGRSTASTTRPRRPRRHGGSHGHHPAAACSSSSAGRLLPADYEPPSDASTRWDVDPSPTRDDSTAPAPRCSRVTCSPRSSPSAAQDARAASRGDRRRQRLAAGVERGGDAWRRRTYQAAADTEVVMPSDSSQRSASMAALQPSAAAVTAWRYRWSWTSPAMKMPSILEPVSSWTTR